MYILLLMFATMECTNTIEDINSVRHSLFVLISPAHVTFDEMAMTW